MQKHRLNEKIRKFHISNFKENLITSVSFNIQLYFIIFCIVLRIKYERKWNKVYYMFQDKFFQHYIQKLIK